MFMGNMRLRYQIPLFVIAILLVATMSIGSSYALWKVTKYQDEANVIKTGCFELTFTEQTSSVNLTNAYPISDEKGLKTEPYTFTLTNTCTIDASYVVYLNTLKITDTDSEGKTIEKISDDLINYSFTKTGSSIAVADKLSNATENTTDLSNFSYNGNLLKSYSLQTGLLAPNESVQYSLRLWINEGATTKINGYQFAAGIATVAYATDSTTQES
jgi:hypothetical protein